MLPITLATEDALSEAIALRMLAEFPTIPIGTSLRRNGNGYLRSRMRSFCEIAHHRPVLLVTDLDTYACAATLCAAWLHRLPRPPKLLMRVAVREIESWLLADHAAMVALLGKCPNIGCRINQTPFPIRRPYFWNSEKMHQGASVPRCAPKPAPLPGRVWVPIGNSATLSGHHGAPGAPPNDPPACSEQWSGLKNSSGPRPVSA